MKSLPVQVDPFRAARVVAVLFFLVGLAVLPFLYYDLVVTPERLGFSKLIVFMVPFLISGIGFAATAIGCVAYNWWVGKAGGARGE